MQLTLFFLFGQGYVFGPIYRARIFLKGIDCAVYIRHFQTDQFDPFSRRR